MNAYVFASQAAAQQCAAIVDAALGMPIAGKDAGGGSHAPAAQTVTTTYFAPMQSASNASQWAYVADAVTTPALAPQAAALGLAAPAALDATWYPAFVAVASQQTQGVTA